MKRSLLPLLAVLTVAVVVSVRGQPPPPTPAATGPEPFRTAGDRPVDIRHIRLDLTVDLPGKTVEGTATLSVAALRRLNSIRLDAVEFEVKKVELTRPDGKPVAARFAHDGKNLVIAVDPALDAGDEATLTVHYRVREPRAGLHFFGPTKDEPQTPLTVWSQGEPITNRYWIPCLDQPNQRQTSELVVTVPEGFEVLSNGALIDRRSDPERKTVTFRWKESMPHPSYLITLVVGQFDVVREEWQTPGTGKPLPVLYYVPKGRKDDVARTFGRTREMLDFFSRRFGIDYAWEKYAQIVVEQFTSGGMENTTATTLTDRALHDERSMLDSSPDALIAHELAHQWWGDLVTCRDWAHLWLNEGFASYSEALWEEHKRGPDEYAYVMWGKGKQALAGGKERPVVDHRYPFPRSMFDARVYPKGAFALHMLRQRLGEKAFWAGIQRWGADHKYQSVETGDFRRTMERVSGRDLERFFYDWLERPGHPVLDVTAEYDAETRAVRILVKQTQPGEAFHFPLTVRVGQGTKPAIVVTEPIAGKEQSLTIAAAPPDIVEIDPEQAVLCEVRESKGRDLWLAQLKSGSTIPARIRAAEHLGIGKTRIESEALAAALNDEKFWGVRVEVAAALGSAGGPAGRDALLAGLKAEHPRVRRACAEQLGKFVDDPAAAAGLKAVLTKGDASYFVEAAALRSYGELRQPDAVALLLPWLAKPSYSDVLRVAALDGLAQTRDASAIDALIAWTGKGKPRPVRLAALSALPKLTATSNPLPEQRTRVLAAVTACLEGETWLMRQAAVNALRDLGTAARPTAATLEALAANDPDERVQEAAKRALVQVRGGTGTTEVEKLREEIEKLRRAQEALQQRLDRFEHKGE